MPQRVSKTVYSWLAENDVSRVTSGTVPGTVQEVVRKACLKAFPAATCRSTLVVKRNGACGPARNEVRRTSRTASRCLTRRARGKAVVTATRRETSGALCRGTSDANLRATGAMNVLGLRTRKTGDSPWESHRALRRDSPRFPGLPAPARAEAGHESGFCKLPCAG
jgi:hypothetical protein